MGSAVKIGQCLLGVVAGVLFFCASTVTAARITSPNYQIDGNLGGSFGGQTGSTSYSMTSLGGEAIVGNGSSGSYILDQRYTDSTVQTMQLGVQPSGLVGFYPMDESTGTTTADFSRYQNDGTLNAPASWYGSGKLGAAVDMNGVGGEVRVSDHASLPSGSAMTVSLWARQFAWGSNEAFAAHWDYIGGGEGSGSWALQTGMNNNLRVFIASSLGDAGDNYVDTDASTWNSFGAWRHIAMTFDGSQAQADRVKVYIDGTRVNVTGYGMLPATLQDSQGDFSIGSFPGLGRHFGGAIDHVKLFDRALGAAEVKAEYEAQNTGASTGFGLEPTPTTSTTSAIDAIVRTNSPTYTIGVEQDHDLQSGTDTIAAIGSSIATPATWSEGTTRGFGFTLLAAPLLDTKWGSGSKYAAMPNAATTFYTGAGNANKTAEVVSMQLRLHPSSSQPLGTYSNNVTYTGTMTP